jgi:flagellar hook-associated protein 3 FlgL
MRVTFNQLHDGIDAVNFAAAQFDRWQQQVQTGKRVQLPSDDPDAMQRIVQERAELGTIDAYVRSADSAATKLAALDTILTDVVERLTDAQATAASARGSTVTQPQREAAANALSGIRAALLRDVNSTFRGTYLFGGRETETVPYQQVAGAWTYQGDNTAVTVDVGRNRSVAVTVDGQSLVQGSDATDLFTELDNLITAVQAGDNTGVANGMAALRRAFDRAVQTQSRLGADQQGIADEQLQLTNLRLASLKRVSVDEDANLAEAISAMERAATAYRAALGAVGTAANQSLLDYLR